MSTPDNDRIDRLAASQAEQARAIRSLDETFQKVLPIIARGNSGSPPANKAVINQTDRTPMWVCVVIVVAMASAMWGRGDSTREDITRLQADVRELRAVDTDLKATDNAVRAYINTGILKPKTEANKGTQ